MRAWQVTNRGDEPAVTDIHLPPPAAGQVRVRIRACGLNFADLLMVKGTYQDTPPPPFTLGLEAAGEITATGPDVSGLAPGDRVAVMAGHGGLAEQGNFAAADCLLLPPSMDWATAAGFQIAYGTSHLALTHRARLAPGETLLVLGAAGGVGLTAVEIGKAMGSRVIASARGADKLAVARAAGADDLIDSDEPGLRDRVKALGGADVCYDAVGGPAFHDALRAMRPLGRMLAIGFASGDVPQVPANLLLVKNLDVMGFYWGGYRAFAPRLVRDSMAQLLAWHAAGRLHPHVSHTVPFDDAPRALDLLRDRRSTGKVVVTMG